ncbi:3-methyl-2-oxobutanoate hydroxymethyltransferase [Kiloniella sp. b19]|uniref:3-methyl-2-oxobutanoate hydroxymethyltransferase n=1 Tax=Kiloniella sp. GXU_MW_B19 TaxID=3141326 RepID=UPI0031D66674
MTKRLTCPAIRSFKSEKRPLVCLTAYSAQIASLLDDHVDLLLVGDSLGMVLYGFDTTLPVTLDMMIAHGAAVVRGSNRAVVAVDLPFGAYQQSPQQAFEAASRVMKETGASAVKLEGGAEMAATIAFLVERGIPVFGHVGLMPQHAQVVGGFVKQKNRDKILADARAVEEAGAFAMVLECVDEDLSREVCDAVSVPVVGIGAGSSCDGQVLVTEDMIGQGSGYVPSFVRQYARVHEDISKAAENYAADVRTGKF